MKLLRPLPLLQSGKMEPGWKSYSSWKVFCWNNLDAVSEAPGDINQAKQDAKLNLSSVHFPFFPLSSPHSPSHSSQIKNLSKVPLYYSNITSWSSEDMLICQKQVLFTAGKRSSLANSKLHLTMSACRRWKSRCSPYTAMQWTLASTPVRTCLKRGTLWLALDW